MFQGAMVALVTPFLMDGSIDWDSLDTLVDFHLAQKTDALVVLGSTGEAATITAEEQTKIVTKVVKRVANRIPVIMGTGTNATASTMQATQQAMSLGVDACLVVTPYYNRPTQEGLYQHFKAVANAAPLPIILYNVPKRTGCDLLPETVARLAECSNIVGIKEAAGDIVRYNQLVQVCLDKELDVYGGDDATCLDLLRLGGQGVISVTGNIAPRLMAELCAAVRERDNLTVTEIDAQLQPFHQAQGCEANPIPVKWALYKMGLIRSPYMRLPLTPLSSEYQLDVATVLLQMGLIENTQEKELK